MKNENAVTAIDKHDPSGTTNMAVDRTVMAADRSLMAWVRTGLSLISFGFTIYKFLEISREQLLGSGRNLTGISSPKLVGLFMIGIGILSIILGIIENVATVKILRGRYQVKRVRYSLFMAIILTLFGFTVFMGILFQLKGLD